jgi:hypothetical protein
MAQSGYEIRYNILRDARDMLFQEWTAKCDIHRRNCDLANKQIETMPEAPTMEAILRRAEELYEFVCRK